MGNICSDDRPRGGEEETAKSWQDQQFYSKTRAHVDLLFLELDKAGKKGKGGDEEPNGELEGKEVTEMIAEMRKLFQGSGVSDEVLDAAIWQVKHEDKPAPELTRTPTLGATVTADEAAAASEEEAVATEAKRTEPYFADPTLLHLTKVEMISIFDKVAAWHVAQLNIFDAMLGDIDKEHTTDKTGKVSEKPSRTLEQKLAEKFKLLDVNGDDGLQKDELKKLLHLLCDNTQHSVSIKAHQSLEEEVELAMQREKDKGQWEELSDDSKASRRSDVEAVVKETHQRTMDEQVAHVFEKYDKNHDDTLSFEEVKGWLSKNLEKYRTKQRNAEFRHAARDSESSICPSSAGIVQ